MKNSLLLAVVAALALAGCNKSTQSPNTTAADTTATPSDYTATGNATATARDTGDAMRSSADRTANRVESSAERMSSDLNRAATSAGNALGDAANSVATAARMAEWKLNASDIQADLTAKREIVRTKDSAGAPTGSSDKSVIESMVKSRLEADSQLAALKLDVDAEKNGEVKLSGKAASAEQVGRAIALALDTEGVTRVASKIRLDEDAGR